MSTYEAIFYIGGNKWRQEILKYESNTVEFMIYLNHTPFDFRTNRKIKKFVFELRKKEGVVCLYDLVDIIDYGELEAKWIHTERN